MDSFCFETENCLVGINPLKSIKCMNIPEEHCLCGLNSSYDVDANAKDN